MKNKLLIATLLTLSVAMPLSSCAKEPTSGTITSDTSTEVKQNTIKIVGANSLTCGAKLQLSASVTGLTNYTLNWSSSDATVASVSNTGLVTAAADIDQETKTVTITCSVAGHPELTASHTITITKDKTISVVISGPDHVTMGKSVTLTCSVENAANDAVTWSTSNDKIATVNNGVVTALVNDHNTEVDITATSVEDKTKSDTFNLKVWVGENERDDVFVEQISINKNFANFEANKNIDSNEKTGFLLKDKDHEIGDDNAVDFKPVTSFIRYNDDHSDVEQVDYKGDWIYDITIYENVDGQLTKLPSDSAFIEGIDKVNCLVNFDESAIGHKFQVKVEPGKLTANQKAQPDYEHYMVVKYDISVIDGFNIYNANELAYIDNRILYPGNAEGVAWDQFKKDHNLDAGLHPTSFVLQSNISVTEENIPDYFLWNKGDSDYDENNSGVLENKLRDKKSIYCNICNNDGGHIELHGNYFHVDASRMPLIPWDDNNPTGQGHYIISDTNFIEFKSFGNHNNTGEDPVGTSLIEDVYFKGNGARNNDSANSGSLIMLWHGSIKATCKNIISECWYQSFSIGSTFYNDMKLLYCKGYDDFTGFVYGAGTKNIIIDHCQFGFCGGPCLVGSCITNDKGKFGTNFTVTNTDFDCLINGSEGWFQGMKVDFVVGGIMALNPLFAPKTVVIEEDKTKYINLISVLIDDDFAKAGEMQQKSINGSLKIDNNDRTYCGDKADPFTGKETDTSFNGLYNELLASKAPLFLSHKGGYAFYNGKALFESKDKPLDRDNTKLFDGDYINFYSNGMMIALGYYNA